MLRYTKNKYKRESVFAKLIDKKVSEYFAVPGKIPTPEDLSVPRISIDIFW